MAEIITLKSGTVIRGSDAFLVLKEKFWDFQKEEIVVPKPVSSGIGKSKKALQMTVVVPTQPRLEPVKPKKVAQKQVEVEIEKEDWYKDLQSL